MAVLIDNVQLNSPGGFSVEEHQDIVAESDVLSSLTDIEADISRALTGIAAEDFEYLVFDC